jgi:hypothetical protein
MPFTRPAAAVEIHPDDAFTVGAEFSGDDHVQISRQAYEEAGGSVHNPFQVRQRAADGTVKYWRFDQSANLAQKKAE